MVILRFRRSQRMLPLLLPPRPVVFLFLLLPLGPQAAKIASAAEMIYRLGPLGRLGLPPPPRIDRSSSTTALRTSLGISTPLMIQLMWKVARIFQAATTTLSPPPPLTRGLLGTGCALSRALGLDPTPPCSLPRPALGRPPSRVSPTPNGREQDLLRRGLSVRRPPPPPRESALIFLASLVVSP